jgi:apolipoprotein N-acyltransferase
LTLVQIADITGVYGISFMVVAVNSIIVDFMLLNKRRKSIPLYPAVPTYLSALLILFFIGGSLYYGYYRLHREPAGGRTKVAVVQGNIEQDKKWDPSYQAVVFSTYLSLTKEVSKRNPDLIVWPETSAPFFFGTDKEYTSLLVDFLRENKIPLVFGNVLIRSLTEGKYRLTNSLVVLNPDGNIIYTYDKIHLVPFGEYVPLRSLLFFVDKIVVGVGDFIPGTDQKLAAVPSGQFAPAICYELAFPSLIRSFFAKGGDFLVTITNDAWFGRTSGPYQHFYMGVFRAIENRKPVIRAANTGISGFIDSYGRVLQKSDLFKQQTLVSAIEKNSKITFYTKYGDLFIYFCLLTVAIIMVNAMFHTKQQHFGGKRW